MKRSEFYGSVRSFIADRYGLAALESAFFVPIFVFATLAVFDVGRGGASRMEIDQALRAGAQVSMLNVTEESEVLAATLAALGETSGGAIQPDGLCKTDTTCVDVSFECECSPGVSASCDSICPGGNAPPSAYLTITAERRQEGILFPDYAVGSRIHVQTR